MSHRASEACCELCRREVGSVTKHHLIPRMRHRSPRNKRMFDRREVRERIAWLCRPCHKQIHAVLSEKELEQSYNSLEALAAHPEIARFVRWVARRPDGTTVTTLRSRTRRGARRSGPR